LTCCENSRTLSQYRAIVRSHDYDEEPARLSRPSIADLMTILDSEEDVEIEILPNGEVRAKGQSSSHELGGRKPLTMREDLGGEYSTGRAPAWTSNG